ncbi:hypothetical protein [Lunatibacter salilacus]|uniref:hypothetical protein n=1 Tax=Lunatibacter salilacus TaxID=2483804 RepID=UPI00131B42DB|nr:hypothetical protein [Lunatibacter salilacus]
MKSNYLIGGCLILLSCNASQQQTADSSFTLLVNDSIQVNYVGMLDLMDIAPNQERILFHNMQNGVILLTDFEGNHLQEMEKRGDSKDSYGPYPWLPARFLENGNFFMIGLKGYQEFFPNGELVKQIPYQTTDVPNLGGRAAADNEFAMHEDIVIIRAITAWGEFNKAEPEYYDSFLQLAKISPQEGKFERFLHLEQESLFKNGRAYDVTEMMPSFTTHSNKLYVISGTDPHLNIYDINEGFKRINRKPIAYLNYYAGEGKEPAKADVRGISLDHAAGKTHALKTYGDYLIATYFAGFDFSDREEYKNLTNESYRAFFEKIEGKYPIRLHVMDLEGNSLADFELSKQLDYRQFLIKDGKMWFLSKFNQEKEEDFVIIYEVELVAE